MTAAVIAQFPAQEAGRATGAEQNKSNQVLVKMNIRHPFAYLFAAALSVAASLPLSAADAAPKPISQVSPSYSFDLRRAGLEGEVVVSFTITPKGDVENAAVVSSTERAFEEPTLAAVRKWKFTPAMKGGVPVRCTVIQPVGFAMTDKNPKNGPTLVAGNSRPTSSQKDAAVAN